MKEAVVFPGQGVQKKGMFMDLAAEYDAVKKIFEEASDAAGIDLLELCREGGEEELSLTMNAQPAILACDIAAWELYRQKRGRPEYVAGFSLGEYAALYAAGCISLRDVFRVIAVRAEAMQKAVPVGEGGMAAVLFEEGSRKKIDDYFDKNNKEVWIANYNTKGQITITGKSRDVRQACDELADMNVLTKQLPVSAPFHCPLLDGVEEKLEEVLEKVKISDAMIPVISNLDGLPETKAEILKRKAIKQAVNPVQWIKTMEYMDSQGVSAYTECGPGHTLGNFIKKMKLEGSRCCSIHNINSFRNL